MRINDAYEHEALLPYTSEEMTVKQTGGCDRTGVQCVDISAPVTLTPTATVGTVTVTCQGSPTVTCTSNAAGTACNVVMTQQVCVSIPVRYCVSMVGGEPTIACAEHCGAGGSCNCGCN